MFLDPFDCSEDICHLAWIVRDNRNLLPYLQLNYGKKHYRAQCINGTLFEDLDPDALLECPSFVLGRLFCS